MGASFDLLISPVGYQSQPPQNLTFTLKPSTEKHLRWGCYLFRTQAPISALLGSRISVHKFFESAAKTAESMQSTALGTSDFEAIS